MKGNILKSFHEEIYSFVLKKVQKLLMRLKGHGRARRPKEKRKRANSKNQTRKPPLPKNAELIKKDYVEKELNCVHYKGGRTSLIKSHKKKFYKENFKPS